MKWILTQMSLAIFLIIMFSGASWAEGPSLSQETDFRDTADLQDRKDGLFRTFGYGMFIAAAGDAASTEWSLSQTGIYERNPLMTNRAVRLSTHVLAPTLAWWATERMHHKGHVRSALLLRIGITAGYSFLTVHNLRAAAR